jgi:hypothetical protein
MYAVFQDGVVFYVGSDAVVAAQILQSQGSAASMVTVDSLEELADLTSTKDNPFDGLSQAAARLLQILDDSGLNAETMEKTTEKLRSQGEKAVAQVRSLGIQGMKTVGDGFVALGDLLRKASETPEKSEK